MAEPEPAPVTAAQLENGQPDRVYSALKADLKRPGLQVVKDKTSGKFKAQLGGRDVTDLGDAWPGGPVFHMPIPVMLTKPPSIYEHYDSGIRTVVLTLPVLLAYGVQPCCPCCKSTEKVQSNGLNKHLHPLWHLGRRSYVAQSRLTCKDCQGARNGQSNSFSTLDVPDLPPRIKRLLPGILSAQSGCTHELMELAQRGTTRKQSMADCITCYGQVSAYARAKAAAAYLEAVGEHMEFLKGRKGDIATLLGARPAPEPPHYHPWPREDAFLVLKKPCAGTLQEALFMQHYAHQELALRAYVPMFRTHVLRLDNTFKWNKNCPGWRKDGPYKMASLLSVVDARGLALGLFAMADGSNANLKLVLVLIKDWMQRTGLEPPRAIYVDNPDTVGAVLREVWPGVQVLGDVFHFLDGAGRTLTRGHPVAVAFASALAGAMLHGDAHVFQDGAWAKVMATGTPEFQHKQVLAVYHKYASAVGLYTAETGPYFDRQLQRLLGGTYADPPDVDLHYQVGPPGQRKASCTRGTNGCEGLHSTSRDCLSGSQCSAKLVDSQAVEVVNSWNANRAALLDGRPRPALLDLSRASACNRAAAALGMPPIYACTPAILEPLQTSVVEDGKRQHYAVALSEADKNHSACLPHGFRYREQQLETAAEAGRQLDKAVNAAELPTDQPGQFQAYLEHVAAEHEQVTAEQTGLAAGQEWLTAGQPERGMLQAPPDARLPQESAAGQRGLAAGQPEAAGFLRPPTSALAPPGPAARQQEPAAGQPEGAGLLLAPP